LQQFAAIFRLASLFLAKHRFMEVVI